MENLTTFQSAIFYLLLGIVSLIAILVIFIFRSSARYYIMFSSKIIFRNIEFINGEIVLIGEQHDEERVKDLIAVQKFPKKLIDDQKKEITELKPLDLEEEEVYGYFNQGVKDDVIEFDFVVNNDPDDDYFNMVEDLDIDADIERDLSDENKKIHDKQASKDLVEIDSNVQRVALESIEKQLKGSSESFLPNNRLHEITNSFDLALSEELEKNQLSEDTINFYRDLGLKLITERFNEFLVSTKKLKDELASDKKKKRKKKTSRTELEEEEIVDWEDVIAKAREKFLSAKLITQEGKTFEMNFEAI